MGPPLRIRLRGTERMDAKVDIEITTDASYTTPAEFESIYYRQNQPAPPRPSTQ